MLNFFAPIYNSVLIFLTDLEEIIPYPKLYQYRYTGYIECVILLLVIRDEKLKPR